MASQSFQSSLYQLRNNRLFEFVVVGFIILSALVIGAKTYTLPPQAILLIELLDISISVFFLLEISIRFAGEPHKSRFFGNAWNLFDTIVVVISLIPIQESELVLLGRLIRIFRVLRMISVIPELRVLINSLLKSLPQLGYVVLLMFIIFYIYAAIGSFLFQAINPVLWGDISISMLTLFRVMTFEDWTDVMYEVMTVYNLGWIYFLSFIFLTTFAFLNMVIGIVVTVIEDENTAQRQAEAKASGHEEPTLVDLKQELADIKNLLQQTKGQ